ncbi:MAG: sulfotransferase [Pseudomonadota bacterium]
MDGLSAQFADASRNLRRDVAASLRAGDLGAALAAMHKMARIPGAPAAVHSDLAKLLLQAKRPDQAIAPLKRAIELYPEDFESWNNLGGAWRRLGRLDDSADAYQRALALRPMASVAANLGLVLRDLNEADQAASAFAQAIELDPQTVAARVHLANLETARGHFDEARQLLVEALAVNPDDPGALAALLKMRGGTPEPAVVQRAEALLERAQPGSHDTRLRFALARAWEQQGCYDKAFAHAQRANQQLARQSGFDLQLLHNECSQLKASVKAGGWNGPIGKTGPGPQPVFVIGLPRSGTTLVEQILASHPQVTGVGESPLIPQLASRLPTFGASAPYPAGIENLKAQVRERLAQAYIDGAGRGVEEPIFVDKLPFNFIYLGLIHVLFPGAPVVHLSRDPRALFVSNYFTEFSAPLQGFRTTPENFVGFFELYRNLMAFWQEHLPELRLATFRYESLVSKPDEEVQRLLSHCGLPWDERVMSFHQTERLVNTPSRWQVRQPMYQSSIDHWRRYEPWLPKSVIDLT